MTTSTPPTPAVPAVRVSLLTSAATNEAHAVELTAQSLLDLLCPLDGYTYATGDDGTCQVRPRKDGPCWSPVTWSPDSDDPEEAGDDAPGCRRAVNARAVSCLVYDLDWDHTPERYAPLEVRLRALGWRYGLHETFTAGRARLVLPLASPLSPRDYPAAWEAGARALGLDGPNGADPTGRDLARVSYLPACPPSDLPGGRACEQGGERWLDPRDLAGSAPASPAAPPPSRPVPAREENRSEGGSTIPKNFVPVDLDSIRRQLSRVHGELRKPLLELADFTLHLRKGERENQLHRLTSAFVSAVEEARGPRGWEVTESLFRPTIERMEDVEREGVGHFVERVHSSWVRATEYAERVEAHNAVLKKTMGDLLSGKLTGDPKKFPEKFDEADDTSGAERGAPWQLELLCSVKEDGTPGKVRPLSSNIDLILTHDPAFRGFIRYNELYRRMEVSGGALAGYEGSYDVALMQWLERSSYRIEVTKSDCGSTLLHHSRKFPYNPVLEYLKGLQWDGTQRIHRVLLERCGAIGNNNYLKSISRKFFISAVARALEPGCQVDTVLVLQGAQGLKKTSFVQCLSRGWYTTSTGRVEDKDMRIQTTESWLVEMSELASLRKSTLESLRGFITERVDRIRIPYATYHEGFPRRCVFVGTTNAAQPLTDEEGNRRWWVVTCDAIDLKGLERDRDQLWAEAVWCYQQHVKEREAGVSEEQMDYRWWLSPEEQRVSNEENEMFTVENTVLLDLQMWQRAKYNANEVLPPMTLTDIARKVLRVSTENLHRDTSLLPRLSKALQVLSWRRIIRQRNGGRYYVYQMPSKEEFEQTVVDA